MTKTINAAAIISETMKNGGVTITHMGKKFAAKNGYLVGGVNPNLVLKVKPENKGELIDAIDFMFDQISTKEFPEYGALMGTWLDRSSGLVYVELSQYIPERFEALEQAFKRAEIAVYDLATNSDIYV